MYSLFGIIRRICEYPRVHPTHNTIRKVDDDAMHVSMSKIIIEESPPDRVHELLSAMRGDVVRWAVAYGVQMPVKETVR
jgi:hypothetical protein